MNASGYNAMPASSAPQAAPKRYDGQDGTIAYDEKHGGHFGASSTIATQGQAPPPETFTGLWSNVSQGLSGQYRDILNTYWQNQVTKLETEDHDYKIHQLPLARIKKVMKADPEVKMISAEAPILFAKGCDIFITELTMRAWIHAEENKRRTLQRSDIASALAKSDMFDFLIDIVPREDATPQHKRRPEFTATGQYTVPDTQAANAVNSVMGQQTPAPQEQSHSMGTTDFTAMSQHVPQDQYQTQTGMFPPPAPQQGYPQPGMFDPSNIYAQYGMAQQPMYAQGQNLQGQRMTETSMSGDVTHQFRVDTEAEEEEEEDNHGQY